MIAGRMRHHLVLYEPTTSVNIYGEEVLSFTATATIHAERVTISGRQSDEVGEHFPDYSVRYNIRDAHDVAERWQVEEVGGYRYTVTAILPNIARGYKTLVCERLNQ